MGRDETTPGGVYDRCMRSNGGYPAMHLVQQATLGGEPRSTYQAVTLIRAVTGAVTGADLSWWDRTISRLSKQSEKPERMMLSCSEYR